MNKLTKSEQKEGIYMTAGRIAGRSKLLKDKRLIALSIKLNEDLIRLKVYDYE